MMCICRKKKSIFYINMLKKWYLPEATCFWTAVDTDQEEEVLPSWQIESNVVPAIGAQLTELQKAQLMELFLDFGTVMSGHCGRTSACQHHIRTKGGLPVIQQPYHIPHVYRDAVDMEIEMMLKERIIEPSTSEWASPMVIIKNKIA